MKYVLNTRHEGFQAVLSEWRDSVCDTFSILLRRSCDFHRADVGKQYCMKVGSHLVVSHSKLIPKKKMRKTTLQVEVFNFSFSQGMTII